MTGLDFIKLYITGDDNWSICQFIDDFNADQHGFHKKISVAPDESDIKLKEEVIVSILVSLADYLFQLNKFEVPTWLLTEKYQLDSPYFISKPRDDRNYIRMLYQTPSSFRSRNIFVNREGLERI